LRKSSGPFYWLGISPFSLTPRFVYLLLRAFFTCRIPLSRSGSFPGVVTFTAQVSLFAPPTQLSLLFSIPRAGLSHALFFFVCCFCSGAPRARARLFGITSFLKTGVFWCVFFWGGFFLYCGQCVSSAEYPSHLTTPNVSMRGVNSLFVAYERFPPGFSNLLNFFNAC